MNAAASLPPSIPLDEAMLCLTCELVFAGTVVWNGRLYLPNYGGGVDVYGLAGGK